MITHANPAMESAAESLFLSKEEYNVRKVALEREEALWERQQNKERIKEQAARIAELEAQLAAKGT